jgi:FkbM family methyltransferase
VNVQANTGAGIRGGLLLLPRLMLSRKIRGATRLTRFLADRFEALQCLPVTVPGGSLYIDLRNNGGHAYLAAPAEAGGEHRILERCVRPGYVAYDIGANVGLYTVWLSSLVGAAGKVIAFEPNAALHKGLSMTISQLPNTRLVPQGLAAAEGRVEFFVPEDDTMASLKDWTRSEGGRVTTGSCSVTTLDLFIKEGRAPRPDLIKCDIEGGELDCFRGGAGLLGSEEAPIILFEANIHSTRGFGVQISDAMEFLASLERPGYTFFKVDDKGELERITSIDFLHGNILAVPRRRLDGLGQPTPAR